jgi:cytoskeletal protein CcmA (bactofilin family)
VSIIAADLLIKGEVHSTGVVRIEGKVEGNLRVDGQVLVANGGLVEGNIVTKEALVAGEVRGSIVAQERVELHATARVRGDVTSPKLAVQEGGVIVGRLRVGEGERAVVQPGDLRSERPRLQATQPAPRLKTVTVGG